VISAGPANLTAEPSRQPSVEHSIMYLLRWKTRGNTRVRWICGV
jgi:hypothetical protein